MKLSRCPVCHSNLHLDQMVMDEAGKQLMALLAKTDTRTGSALLSYIGLFRPIKSDLNNGRANRLVHEVLELTTNLTLLKAALDQVVNQLGTKRQSGDARPLANHNYLKKVLEGMASEHHHPVATAKNKTAAQ